MSSPSEGDGGEDSGQGSEKFNGNSGGGGEHGAAELNENSGDESDDNGEVEEIDPADIYTLEDFMAEDEILQKLERKILEKRKARRDGDTSARLAPNSPPKRHVPRDRGAGHGERLVGKDSVEVPLDLNENPNASVAVPPEMGTSANPNPVLADVLWSDSAIHARSTLVEPREDLMEHTWQRKGNKEN